MLVVERLVVGDAGPARVDLRAAELLGRDVLAGRGLHQRRPAEEDRPGATDDDGLVAHRRDVGAAGRARAHHQRDLRDPGGRHPGLVVEDPAEVVAVGKDVGLERQERAARVDQVDARQPVLERDLLGAEVLLDGHRVVGAALDRGVVGDDDAGRPLDPADAGDDPGARRVVVVQAGRRQRAQLEERRARDRAGARCARGPAACRARDGGRSSARRHRRRVPRPAAWRVAEVGDEAGQRVVVRPRLGGRGVEPAAQDGHGPMIGRAPAPRGGRRTQGPPQCRVATGDAEFVLKARSTTSCRAPSPSVTMIGTPSVATIRPWRS